MVLGYNEKTKRGFGVLWQRGETMHSAKEHSLVEEQALLTAVRDGSQEAFARLAARYDGMLSARLMNQTAPRFPPMRDFVPVIG